MSAPIETPTPAAVTPPTPTPAATPAATPTPTPTSTAKPGSIDALQERPDTWDAKAWAAERKAERERAASEARGTTPEKATPAPKTETPASAAKTEPAAVAADPATAAAPAVEITVKLRGAEKKLPIEQVAGALGLPVAAVATIVKEHGEGPIATAYQKLWNGDQAASEKATIEREKAALERKMRTVFAKATSTPAELARMIFENAGASQSVKEIALQIAQEEIELEGLPEDTRKLRKLEQELARERSEREALLAEHEAIVERQRVAEQQAKDEKFVKDFNEEIIAALTAAKLPTDGFTRKRLLDMLAAEKAELGERYLPPSTRADMAARFKRHIETLEAEADALVAARAQALGVEGFAEKHAPIAEQIGERAAEKRLDTFRKNSRAQTQGKAERAEETEQRPPIRRGEDIMAWIDRVFN